MTIYKFRKFPVSRLIHKYKLKGFFNLKWACLVIGKIMSDDVTSDDIKVRST